MTSLHRDPKLRASDADRDEVAEQLRENAATGRLTMDEFGERLERCFAAQTYGDLEPLLVDLPGPGPYSDLPVPFPSVTRPGSGVARFEHGWPGLAHRNADWTAWASASTICWGIWLASFISGGGMSGFWPVWVTVPWGAVLLASSFTGDKAHQLEPPRQPALPPAQVEPGRQGRSGRRAERMDVRRARRADRVRRRLE